MVNLVILYVALGGMFLLSFVIYYIVVGKLFPSVFLRPSFKGVVARDRGIKRYTYDDGRAIVYTPSLPTKNYIEQYILSSNNGEKFLRCKVDQRVISIEYDVICFNGNDKVIDAVTVKDPVKIIGITDAVALDSETAYVNVIAKKVNGVKLTKKKTARYSSISVTVYVILSAIYTAFQVLLTRGTILYAMDQLYNTAERFSNGGVISTTLMRIANSVIYFFDTVGALGTLGVLAITLTVSVVFSLFVVLLNLSSNKGIRGDGPIAALFRTVTRSKKGVRHVSK